MNEILNCIYRLIVENLIGIASVVVMLLILWETIRWHRKESTPQLIYTLGVINENMVIGKLENIGNGIAYNINVKCIPTDVKIFGGKVDEKFDDLNYLSPKSSYPVQYGYLNTENNVTQLIKHDVVVSWTEKQKSKKQISATFFIGEDFFKSYPRKIETAQQIKELKDTIEKVIKNKNNKW